MAKGRYVWYTPETVPDEIIYQAEADSQWDEQMQGVDVQQETSYYDWYDYMTAPKGEWQ